MRIIRVVVLGFELAIATAGIGCGKSDTTLPPAAPAAGAGVQPQLLTGGTKPPEAFLTPPVPEQLPVADRSVPVESYLDLNAEPDGLALMNLIVAKGGESLPDEEKLRRLSLPYINESNAFKRQEIARAELPKLNQKLDVYRRSDYFSVPIAGTATQPLILNFITLGSYDFASKSFKLDRYGRDCWGSSIGAYGASMKIQSQGFTCDLVVPDEALARMIEEARSKSLLEVRGTAYLFAPKVVGTTAHARLARAHVELFNVQTKAAIAAFDL